MQRAPLLVRKSVRSQDILNLIHEHPLAFSQVPGPPPRLPGQLQHRLPLQIPPDVGGYRIADLPVDKGRVVDEHPLARPDHLGRPDEQPDAAALALRRLVLWHRGYVRRRPVSRRPAEEPFLDELGGRVPARDDADALPPVEVGVGEDTDRLPTWLVGSGAVRRVRPRLVAASPGRSLQLGPGASRPCGEEGRECSHFGVFGDRLCMTTRFGVCGVPAGLQNCHVGAFHPLRQ